MISKDDRNNYAEVLEDMAYDLRYGEDAKNIAGGLRSIADEIDPPRGRKK